MQSVEFLTGAVALDPRKTRIDHEMNPRHGQRRFGDIGRQHDAPLRTGIEYAVLVARRQPRIQRQNFSVTILAFFQRLMCIADFALAGQEDQHVAHLRLADDLVAGRHDAVEHRAPAFVRIAVAVAVVAVITACIQWPITHIDRITSAFHVHYGRIAEVLRKPIGIDGGRGHDHFQIAPLLQQLLEITQQEIDIEAALVRLVDDDGVVRRQPAVGLYFGKQNAVGHELDSGPVADVVVETHLIADQPADLRFQLFGHASRHRARGDPARLGTADHPGGATASSEAQLRQLRSFTGAGFARDHNHLVIANQRDDAFGLASNG